MSFRIERAVTSQIDALCAIERAAVQMFRGHEIWPFYQACALPPDIVREAIARGHIWVALNEIAEPVGFICLDAEEGGASLGIAELDVMPEWGRQGIGGALLQTACEWAGQAGYARIDLGTLPEVPWNEPFYARHGFVKVDKNDKTCAFALKRDRENGFPDHLRIFMSKSLNWLPTDWSVWPAPAKLNLFLRIIGRRADGYHELQTVFRLLDWGDEIRLKIRNDGAIERCDKLTHIPAEKDLTLRAAHLLKKYTGSKLGAQIEVHKRIPMGGGLGGGSSDAATVLVALNWLWRLNLSTTTLADLGKSLGADVPVFVHGRSAWATGIGEKVKALRLPHRWYAIIDPHEYVSTEEIFQANELTRDAMPATISTFQAGQTLENVFEPVVRAQYSRIAAALDWLSSYGLARLSGSGGCIFIESSSREKLENIVKACPPELTAYIAEGVDHSPLQLALKRFSRQA